ncbi:MAG: hypothetical protein ACO3CC_18140, partial [Alphaproteobacteria bacterium]
MQEEGEEAVVGGVAPDLRGPVAAREGRWPERREQPIARHADQALDLALGRRLARGRRGTARRALPLAAGLAARAEGAG